MHGRVKKEKPPSDTEIENDRKKSAMYNKLMDIVFACRAKKEHSVAILELTSKVLKTNPDVYSIWNFRREIFLDLNSGVPGVSEEVPPPTAKVSQELAKEIVDEELALSTEAIKKNSKSYGAWYHRIWICDRFEVDIDAELALCKQFLTYDQRNFHCWNYRRYLVSMANVSHSSEFQFSTDKISENFSNYSAFHHRSVYISSLVLDSDDQGANQSLFEEEFSIIENAVFTEPDDQSAWWYYHFLLKFALQKLSLDKDWLDAELRRQSETLDSLLEVEPSSKWCMLAKIFLISTLLEVVGVVGEETDVIPNSRRFLVDERQRVTEGLCILDPTHVNRYRYMLKSFVVSS